MPSSSPQPQDKRGNSKVGLNDLKIANARYVIAVGAMLAISAAAIAAGWAFEFKPVNAQMAIYSGGLGDPAMPTAQEAKVSFHVQGKAARDLFEHLGPDAKNECSSDAKVRVRAKERLQCIRYSKSDYSCYFGFDLKDGKSIGGSIC